MKMGYGPSSVKECSTDDGVFTEVTSRRAGGVLLTRSRVRAETDACEGPGTTPAHGDLLRHGEN